MPRRFESRDAIPSLVRSAALAESVSGRRAIVCLTGMYNGQSYLEVSWGLILPQLVMSNMADIPEGFDGELYLRLNPDVAAAGCEPADHYLRYGRAEGRRWRLAPPSTTAAPRLSESEQRQKDGRYYSALAKAMRRVAEVEADSETGQLLLRIAKQYEEIADDLMTAPDRVRHAELMRTCERLRRRS